MDEGSKVRFVRCPKCENLLSELPEYSVYKCGGCGAILRGIFISFLLYFIFPFIISYCICSQFVFLLKGLKKIVEVTKKETALTIQILV